jgi:methyl-accepting chemotaxis protein
MSNFFSPAIKFSNALSFKAKFIVVSLLCIVPLIFFFALLTAEQIKSIKSAEYELKASRYIVPLRNLVEHIAQTRGMTNVYLNGDKSIEGKIKNKRSMVNNDFEQLLVIDQQLGAVLSTQGFPLELKNQWQSITQQAFKLPTKEVFQRYTQLIAKVIDFMDTIARQGHMLQDADAANSYLINSLLQTIPNQVEALGQLRGKGAGVIAAKALTTDNKLLITSLADTRTAKKLQKDVNYLFKVAPEIEQTLASTYQTASSQLTNYLALAQKEIINAEQPSINANHFFSEGTKAISSLLSLFDQMQPILDQRMKAHISATQDKLYFYSTLVVIVILLLAYAYMGIYLAIRESLKAMMTTADALSQGDLDARLTLATQDELKLISTGINEIAEGMSQAIAAIHHASDEISTNATEVADASNKTAQGMQVQSQELAQVSTAITQMSASINEVAQNTEQGTTSAQNACTKSTNGSDVVQNTIEAINILATNIEQAVQGVNVLRENSNNITSILDVIKGIADQTNLLALNAAIEAARAGEQGRGFAVVADEVRTLAQRTQDSTLEIHNMIELIQSGITDVSGAMDKSQTCAQNAVQHSEQAGEVLIDITKSVTEITDMSSQIAAAVEEQSVVSDEVARSIVTISDVANDSSEAASSLAKTGSHLLAMSEKMKAIVSRYKTEKVYQNSTL